MGTYRVTDDKYRVSLSAVFWCGTPEDVEAALGKVREVLHPDDQDAVIANVDYVADGRPDIPTQAELQAVTDG